MKEECWVLVDKHNLPLGKGISRSKGKVFRYVCAFDIENKAVRFKSEAEALKKAYEIFGKYQQYFKVVTWEMMINGLPSHKNNQKGK
jgi:hypothetical protein